MQSTIHTHFSTTPSDSSSSYSSHDSSSYGDESDEEMELIETPNRFISLDTLLQEYKGFYDNRLSAYNAVDIAQVKDVSKITRIDVFDFDGTLFLTPLPDEAIPWYMYQTGMRWPHRGWWGVPDSLTHEHFRQFIRTGPAMQRFVESVQSEETITLLLTGRDSRFKVVVTELLLEHEIRPHRSYFKPVGYDGQTLDYKLLTLQELANEFLHARTMTIFEDREEHVEKFRELDWQIRSDLHVDVVHVFPEPCITEDVPRHIVERYQNQQLRDYRPRNYFAAKSMSYRRQEIWFDDNMSSFPPLNGSTWRGRSRGTNRSWRGRSRGTNRFRGSQTRSDSNKHEIDSRSERGSNNGQRGEFRGRPRGRGGSFRHHHSHNGYHDSESKVTAFTKRNDKSRENDADAQSKVHQEGRNAIETNAHHNHRHKKKESNITGIKAQNNHRHKKNENNAQRKHNPTRGKFKRHNKQYSRKSFARRDDDDYA